MSFYSEGFKLEGTVYPCRVSTRYSKCHHIPANPRISQSGANRISRMENGGFQSINVDLAKNYPFGKEKALQFTESIVTLNADKMAAETSPRALFAAYGKDHLLHPLDESQALFESAPYALFFLFIIERGFHHKM
jgi:hypothetical protein